MFAFMMSHVYTSPSFQGKESVFSRLSPVKLCSYHGYTDIEQRQICASTTWWEELLWQKQLHILFPAVCGRMAVSSSRVFFHAARVTIFSFNFTTFPRDTVIRMISPWMPRTARGEHELRIHGTYVSEGRRFSGRILKRRKWYCRHYAS